MQVGIETITLDHTALLTATAGALGSTLWQRKSPDEILLDMHTLGNQRGAANAIVMGTGAFNQIATMRLDNNMTVLEFFLATSAKIKYVGWSHLLDAGEPGSGDGMVVSYRTESVPNLRAIACLAGCTDRTVP